MGAIQVARKNGTRQSATPGGESQARMSSKAIVLDANILIRAVLGKQPMQQLKPLASQDQAASNSWR